MAEESAQRSRKNVLFVLPTLNLAGAQKVREMECDEATHSDLLNKLAAQI